MLVRPPLYEQETAYSCVPACLRMVLAASGILKTEEELRGLCDCTALEGTSALRLVDAARALGFAATRKQNITLEELEAELVRGVFPIAYVNTRLSPTNLSCVHAVVVIALEESQVHLLDPTRGETRLAQEAFLNEWNAMRRLTIIVEA